MKDDKVCFVLAPLGESEEERTRADYLFRHLILPCVEPFGYTPVRLDQLRAPRYWLDDGVLAYIANSQLLVADLTGHDSFVFYGLARRHALGRPVVQISTDDRTLPPIDGQDTIFVELNDPDSIAIARRRCTDQIKSSRLEADLAARRQQQPFVDTMAPSMPPPAPPPTPPRAAESRAAESPEMAECQATSMADELTQQISQLYGLINNSMKTKSTPARDPRDPTPERDLCQEVVDVLIGQGY
ncbi:MAG: hypothetical protein K2Q10_08855 [Rhodospirillales bacterium]|nr:hypothetical protein [Rhodospirillales bacterium]